MWLSNGLQLWEEAHGILQKEGEEEVPHRSGKTTKGEAAESLSLQLNGTVAVSDVPSHQEQGALNKALSDN